jgi:predicted Zn-dependent peptidase
MYHVTRLENGLTVATAEMPHMASVSLGIWVGVGSRYEPAAANGVCHFIEHLLFKGTRRRSAKAISQAIEGIGGYLNAFTSEDMTCFHSRARHDRFDELLDVLGDMFLNSKFDLEEINKEREVIKEEVAMYLDQPQQHVQELLNATLWPDQPLGRPITGTEKTLDAMGRNLLVDHLRASYVANSTVIAAAGRLKHDQVLRAVRPLSRHFRAGPRPRPLPVHNRQRQPQVCLFTRKTEQTHLALGVRTCSRHDPRRFSLRLLNTILGENMSSRLFQIIREDRGLAYSIYSTPSFFEDTGDLVISASLDTENLVKTMRLIMRELRRLGQCPPTAGELRRARDFVIGQIELGLESADNQMNWIGEQWLGYGRIFGPGHVKRRLLTVTASQICAAAREFFRPANLNLALVSPRKTARDLLPLLSA